MVVAVMRVIFDIFLKDKGEIRQFNVKRVTATFALHSDINAMLSGYENILLKEAMLGMTKIDAGV